jgi:hypothetical protein
MTDSDEIKAIAKKIWPDADHIDLMLGAASKASFSGKDPESVRVIAVHADGSIMGQVIADDLDELQLRAIEHLRGKAKF